MRLTSAALAVTVCLSSFIGLRAMADDEPQPQAERAPDNILPLAEAAVPAYRPLKGLNADLPPPETSDTSLLNRNLPLPDSLLQQAYAAAVLKRKNDAKLAAAASTRTVVRPLPEPAELPEPIHLALKMVKPAPVAPASTARKQVDPPLPARPSDALWQRVEAVIAAAERANAEYTKYAKAVDNYSNWHKRLGERFSDMLNYSLLFKGVSPSSEAGDVILSEKTKLKSLAAAKYMKQKLEDQIQMRVLSDVMQMATGLGVGGARGQAHVQQGLKDLTEAAGKAEADSTVALLKQISQQARQQQVPKRTKPLWSVRESENRVQKLACAATEADPVIADIKKDVHHYNQHSKGAMAAHRIARTALSAASLTPDFVGPAAQVILFAYITVSGGTEQDKLLRELYIDKRLTSHATLLYEEAHLALYNYQLACLTRNSLLQDCSRRLANRLAGAETAAKLLAPES